MHWRALVLLVLLAQGRGSPLPPADPVPVPAPAHKTDGNAIYRLPKTQEVVPSLYQIRISPQYVNGRLQGIEKFEGEVKITAEVKDSTKEIYLNCDEKIVLDTVRVFQIPAVEPTENPNTEDPTEETTTEEINTGESTTGDSTTGDTTTGDSTTGDTTTGDTTTGDTTTEVTTTEVTTTEETTTEETTTEQTTTGPTDGSTDGITDSTTDDTSEDPTKGPTDGPTEGPTDGPTDGPTVDPGDPELDIEEPERVEKDLLLIKMKSPIPADTEIRIEITYSRPLQDGDLNGLYISTYTDSAGAAATVLATQFEPTSARKAFPSFDEPKFKAAFDLSIVVTDEVDAIANTPGTRTGNVVTFERTPVMSTYLLAMTIMEDESFGTRQGESDEFRTFARREALESNQGTLSQNDMPAMLEFLSGWTDISWNGGSVEEKTGMELKKMDQAAIPDFSAGAMENWGLVLYRESALLFEQGGSTAAKKRISQVIAHELAHQWFGNWVTTEWWNTIWLNEGFADIFEYIVMADRYGSSWLMDERMVLDEQMYAFDADSSLTSPALSLDEDKVENPDDISNHFGTITYSKGGSILRQIRNVIGEDEFQEAVRQYLSEMAFQAAVPEDLFKHFVDKNEESVSQLPDDELLKVLDNWTKNAGYPVVTVDKINDTAIRITQSRFLLQTSATTDSYDIFLTWVTDQDDTPTKPLEPKEWLRKGVPSIDVDLGRDDWQWVIVNPYQAGYYRVDYSEELWNNLQTAMESSHQNMEKISALDRAALINNGLNLARAGRNMNYDDVFTFMLFLSHDGEFLPWAAARSALAFVQRVTANAIHYKDFIHKIVDTRFTSVGFEVTEEEDNNVGKTHRLNVLTLACGAGYSDCLDQAEERLDAALEVGGEDVHPDLRSVVYCYGLKRSKAADLWDKLWEKYTNEIKDMTQRQLIASALGCVNNGEKLTEYLEKSVETGTVIPRDERYLVFSAVYANPDGGPQAALDFVEEKTAESLVAAYGTVRRVASLLNGLAGYLTEEEHLATLEAVTEGVTEYAAAVTTLENNIKWRSENEAALTRGLRKAGAPTAALTASLALLCAAVLRLFR